MGGVHYARSGASSAAGASATEGNGLMVNMRGFQKAVVVHGLYPAEVENGSGVGGDILVKTIPWLGMRQDMLMTVAGDEGHDVQILAFAYSISRIHIGVAKGVVDNLNCSIWTGNAQNGEKLFDISASAFAALTDKTKFLELTPTTPILREGDYLYLRVNTPNTARLLLSMWVYGDIKVTNDKRGMPL